MRGFQAIRLRGLNCDDRLPAHSTRTALPFRVPSIQEMAIDAQGDAYCATLLDTIR